MVRGPAFAARDVSCIVGQADASELASKGEGRMRLEDYRDEIDTIDEKIAALLAFRILLADREQARHAGPDEIRSRAVVGRVRAVLESYGVADRYDVAALWGAILDAERSTGEDKPREGDGTL